MLPHQDPGRDSDGSHPLHRRERKIRDFSSGTMVMAFLIRKVTSQVKCKIFPFLRSLPINLIPISGKILLFYFQTICFFLYFHVSLEVTKVETLAVTYTFVY